MQIISCPECRTQYDITTLDTIQELDCPCGEKLPLIIQDMHRARIKRCGACGGTLEDGADACHWCGAQVAGEDAGPSTVCPECYARNPERHEYCAECGVHFEPQPPPIEAGRLQCPVCVETRMVWRVVGTVAVQECGKCQGLWVPGDKLELLLDRASKTMLSGAPRGRQSKFQRNVVYRKCPECSMAMQRRNYGRTSGVIVDWCGHHGGWLDAGELNALARFVASVPGGDLEEDNLPQDPDKGIAAAAIIQFENHHRQERSKSWMGSGSANKSITDFLRDLLAS